MRKEKDYFDVQFDSCVHCWVPDVGIKLKVGDTLRIYGRGFGYPHRGIEINDQVVNYETAEQYETRRQQELALDKQRKIREYQKQKPKNDVRIQKLPLEFQERLYGFRGRREDFGPEREGYELFCCEEAVKFAHALKTPEAVIAFGKLPWDEQKKKVSNIDDGHSGNTFGAAVRLAFLYLKDKTLVPQEHATICPLMGCEHCGCWVTTQEAVSA